MVSSKNPSHTHNGKGTAIIINDQVKIQPTRKIYNNEKMASCLITTVAKNTYNEHTFISNI